MGELRQKFEAWFKTTTAYRMLESMNYYKMDLFHFVGERNEYRHTSVQMVFMTWVEQQSKIEQLKKEKQQALNLINNWWHSDVDQKLFIEDLEKALRGECE